MNIVCVVPVIDEARARRLYQSMAPRLRARTLWVVNTQYLDQRHLKASHVEMQTMNVGVAAAWNLGRRRALDRGAWLLHCSESMVMGPSGGMDVLEAIEAHADAPWLGFIDHGWHLYANSPQLLEDVGTFDENFWPAYYEETDYLYRMHLAGWPSPRENDLAGGTWLENEATNPDGDAHCVTEGLVHVTFGPLTEYYVAKWGGDSGHEKFTQPFDGEHDHRWWPTPAREGARAWND